MSFALREKRMSADALAWAFKQATRDGRIAHCARTISEQIRSVRACTPASTLSALTHL